MPRTTRARRRNMLALPAAVATITSLIFGINAEALAADSPDTPQQGHKDARHAPSHRHDALLERERPHPTRDGDGEFISA